MTTLLLSLLTALPAQARDWPQFRGPGGLGRSPEKGLPVSWSATENLHWKAELPGAGASSPIALGKLVVVTCASGFGGRGRPRGDIAELKRHVVALDRETGEILWNREFPAKLPEETAIREGHGYATSTPAADAERLYVFFGKSGVYALDHTGRQLWETDVGSKTSGWGSAASPVLSGDLVIVNASVESESLVALDRRTGKEAWRAEGIREAWNTPLLVAAGGKSIELAVAVPRQLLGFDPRSGERLWSCETDIGWYMAPSLVASEGIICSVGGRSGGSLAVRAGGRGDVTRSHRLWTGRKGSNVSSPVLHEGYLYWVHENLGVAYCAAAKTGAIVYEERLGGAGQIYASPVVADGRLYYVTRNGRTFVLAAKPELELLAVNDLRDGGTFNASPAVAGGRLLLRSDRFLYSIGRR